MYTLKERIAIGDEQQRARGGRDGRRWADRTAGGKELRRLQRAVEASDGTGHGTPDSYVGVHFNGGNGEAASIAEDITGEKLVYNAARRFWSEVSGSDDDEDEMGSEAYLTGFVEGALEVFEATRSRT